MNQKDLNPRLGQNEPEQVMATQLENNPINLVDDLFNRPVEVSESSGPSVLIEVPYQAADTVLSWILWQGGMAAIPEDDIAVKTKPIEGRGIGRRVVQITVPIRSAANSVTRDEADISHKPSGNDVVGEYRSDTSEVPGEELSRSLQPGGRGLRVVERNTNTRPYKSNSFRSLRKRHPSEGKQPTLGRKVQGILYDTNRTMHGVVVRVGDVINDLQSMIEGRQIRKEFLAHSPAEAVFPQVNERARQLIIESIVYDPGLGLKAPLTGGHNTQAGFAHAKVISPKSGEYGVYAGGEMNYIHEPEGADFTQIKREEKVPAQVLSYQILEEKAKVLALIAHVDSAYRDQVELTVGDDLKHLDTMFNLLVSSWGIHWSWNELKELARTKIDAQQVAYKVSEVIGAGTMALAACVGSGAPVEIPPMEPQQAGEVQETEGWVAIPNHIPETSIVDAVKGLNLSEIRLLREADATESLTVLARADNDLKDVETLWYMGDGVDESGQVVKFMVQAKTKSNDLNVFTLELDENEPGQTRYRLANENGVVKYWFSVTQNAGMTELRMGEMGGETEGWLMQTLMAREQEIAPTAEAPAGELGFWELQVAVAQGETVEPTVAVEPSPVPPPEAGELRLVDGQVERFTGEAWEPQGEADALVDLTLSSGEPVRLVVKDGQLVMLGLMPGEGDRPGLIYPVYQAENNQVIIGTHTYLWEGGKLVEVVLTEADFLKLTTEQRQGLWDMAPETIDGLAKSNFSTLIPYLVIYRDENGEGLQVFNLLTRGQTSLLEAGIAEFMLSNPYFPSEFDGTKGEMLAFAPKILEGASQEETEAAQIKALEEMFDYMVNVTEVKWGDIADFIRGSVPQEYGDEFRKSHPLMGNIQDIEGNWQRRYLPLDLNMPKKDKFILWIDSVEYHGKTYVLLRYRSPLSEYHMEDMLVMAVMSEGQFMRLLDGRKVTIPPKP